MKYFVYVQTLPGCPQCLEKIDGLVGDGHTVEVLDDDRLQVLPPELRRDLGAAIHNRDTNSLPIIIREDEL